MNGVEMQICDRLYTLKRYVESKCGGRGVLAEDIYGDALVKIWEFIRSGKFKEGFSIDAFMKRCAWSVLCDYYRGKNRTKRIYNDEYEAYVSSMTRDFEREYEALLESKLLMKKIEKLKPLYRRILALALFQNMTHYEIAETLGMREATVGCYLSRLRSRLRIK